MVTDTESLNNRKVAVIIGAGPAGLTAAYELLTRTDIHPIVLEVDPTYVGGISKTVEYRGNRIDIGGHRFFSKSDRVMDWWFSFMSPEITNAAEITYRGEKIFTSQVPSQAPADLLLRERKTHIYHKGVFFTYPITLSFDTLQKLGVRRLLKICITYMFRKFFPRTPVHSLEDFFINRFGDELYSTFFKSYTEKVWGLPCTEISPDWGAQRVKGLSISAIIIDILKKPFRKSDVAQKGTETSLIERFLYPKYGPGYLWEKVASEVLRLGGEIHMNSRAVGLSTNDNNVTHVTVRDGEGNEYTLSSDYVFSTMPVRDLGKALDLPESVREVSDALQYREFITVGILLKEGKSLVCRLTDTWIYIHEPSVDVGRIQFFNNWSPFMVADPKTTWIGLEYFCAEGDRLWSMKDSDLYEKAKNELVILGLAELDDIIDGTVLRQEKAYTSYSGSYARFDEIRAALDQYENLFPIGRNGMHRYNNQDHSMLVAMVAVDTILKNSTDKESLWKVNTEQEYQEEK